MTSLTAHDPAPAAARPPRGRLATIESLALGAAIACGLVAWGVGLRTCGYDYDEVVRAHSVWLASQGLRPYNDFFEVHPPYFALLVPVIRGMHDPLLALRIFAAAGNLLFLGGLGVLAARLVEGDRRWAWLGLAVVATQPDVLNDLVEFRIDGWGYALAAWALVRHGRRGADPGPARDFELGAVTGLATLLFCPKLTILPALVVLAAQARGRPTLGRAARAGLAYLAGVGVAGGLFLGWLAWQGIEAGRMFQLLVRYHAVSGANASFRLGLLRAIGAHPAAAGAVGAGVVAWAVGRAARRTRPGAYELGLLAWLAAQAVLVAYPYKQYYAPWFLFAAGYLAFVGQGASPRLARARFVPFLAAAAWAGTGAVQAARAWAATDVAATQRRVHAWIDRVADPEDRIVTSAPFHPIDRRDTFFVWFNTADNGGFDSERILARLPSYREVATPGRSRAELEAHPPALVFITGDRRAVEYTQGQDDALVDFLPRHGYRTVDVGSARFAVRPDRFDRP